MTHDPSEQHRPPFVVADDFLETAFERRFQGILRRAWQHRSWHIIAALPGSGKSWGIGDLVLSSGAYKAATGITRLPILAIRAPSNSARDSALATTLAAAFGIIPRMTGAALRVWLVQEMAHDGVECLIIDDAHELTLPHLALLKELTDKLAAPPFQRRVGLCLVAATGGNVVPFRATLAGPEPLVTDNFADAWIPNILTTSFQDTRKKKSTRSWQPLREFIAVSYRTCNCANGRRRSLPG
jgi:hypothetical protein